MFLKAAKCPHCKCSLPLCSALHKISLPPREVTCAKCSGKVKTSFEFRMNWISNTIFRISVLGFSINIFAQTIHSNVPILVGLVAAVIFGFLFGAVFSYIVSIIAAPILQLVLETGHTASKIAGAATNSSKTSQQVSEEARLAAFVDQDEQSQPPA